MAQSKLLECEKELSGALESSGGLRRPETLEQTLRIANQRVALEDNERRLCEEKEARAEEEKESWDTFTAALRTLYSKEQNVRPPP